MDGHVQPLPKKQCIEGSFPMDKMLHVEGGEMDKELTGFYRTMQHLAGSFDFSGPLVAPEEQMAKLIARMSSSEVVEAELQLPTSLSFRKGKKSYDFTKIKEVDKMVEDFGKPAAFGKGSETVIDPEVRRATAIDLTDFDIKGGTNAARGQFAMFTPSWELDNEESIVEALEPMSLERKIEIKLHKINVYKPGDFFTPHRDTLASEDMFGTLVVQLDSKYEGGELVIWPPSSLPPQDGNEGKAFGYTEPRSFGGRGKGRAVAFFADCYHQVKPVTSGRRVTVTYTLSYSDVSAPIPRSPPEMGREIWEAVDRLASKVFPEPELGRVGAQFSEVGCSLPRGELRRLAQRSGLLGFLMVHQYATVTIPKKQGAEGTGSQLHGQDATLMEALTSPANNSALDENEREVMCLKSKVELVGHYEEGNNGVYSGKVTILPERGERPSLPDEMKSPNMAVFATETFTSCYMNQRESIWQRAAGSAFANTPYIAHTGNESQSQEMSYINACLVIRPQPVEWKCKAFCAVVSEGERFLPDILVRKVMEYAGYPLKDLSLGERGGAAEEGTPTERTPTGDYEEQLAQLMAMGFDRDTSMANLVAYQGNVNAAIDSMTYS